MRHCRYTSGGRAWNGGVSEVAALQGAPYVTVQGADKFIGLAPRNFFFFETDVFLIF
jgi:hypothetical protein